MSLFRDVGLPSGVHYSGSIFVFRYAYYFSGKFWHIHYYTNTRPVSCVLFTFDAVHNIHNVLTIFPPSCLDLVAITYYMSSFASLRRTWNTIKDVLLLFLCKLGIFFDGIKGCIFYCRNTFCSRCVAIQDGTRINWYGRESDYKCTYKPI